MPMEITNRIDSYYSNGINATQSFDIWLFFIRLNIVKLLIDVLMLLGSKG